MACVVFNPEDLPHSRGARRSSVNMNSAWRAAAPDASHMLLSTLAISSKPSSSLVRANTTLKQSGASQVHDSWLSIVEERASASRALHLYRSQNLSWVDDISNSDVADAAGSSCYISSGRTRSNIFGAGACTVHC